MLINPRDSWGRVAPGVHILYILARRMGVGQLLAVARIARYVPLGILKRLYGLYGRTSDIVDTHESPERHSHRVTRHHVNVLST